ncbi:unnamed protein product [Calypogeia fissa]
MKLVAGSYERFLWGWQVRARKSQLDLAFSYPAHVGPVKCIAACGSIVATGGSDDTIRVYDVSAGKDMGSLFHHTGAVTCLDFFLPEVSPLQRPTHLFSGSEDGTIAVWDTESWTHLKSMKGHKTALNSLTVHPTGKVALSVERDGHLKMWNLLNGRCTYTYKLPSEGTLIKFSPQTGESYALARGEVLDIYTVETGLVEHSLGHEKKILCLAQNQDGLVFTGGEDRVIRAWDTRSGKLAISVPKAHSNRIRGICTLNSPESAELPHLLASASSDGSVRIWDTRMHHSIDDSASPSPAFETSTKARLTCLVSCGSAKKLESVSLASPQDADASTKKVLNGTEDHTALDNGGSNKAETVGKKKKKAKRKSVVVEVQETLSQVRKKKKKKMKHHLKST